ncbi:MAG: MFS transporter [Promethearchaeota archaeon]
MENVDKYKVNSNNLMKKREHIFKVLQIFHFYNDGFVLLFPVLMVNFFDKFSLTWFQTGLIFAMNTLMIIFFQILNGMFVDKGRGIKILYFGMILVALSSFLLYLAIDFISLLFIAIICGVSFGFVHSINYTMTIHLFPEDKKEKLAKQGFAGDLGKLIAIFMLQLK